MDSLPGGLGALRTQRGQHLIKDSWRELCMLCKSKIIQEFGMSPTIRQCLFHWIWQHPAESTRFTLHKESFLWDRPLSHCRAVVTPERSVWSPCSVRVLPHYVLNALDVRSSAGVNIILQTSQIQNANSVLACSKMQGATVPCDLCIFEKQCMHYSWYDPH